MSAAELKQRGNAAFSEGNFNEAISLFSEAIALEPVNEVLYCNRSMAHASLENWEQSVADAKNVLNDHDSIIHLIMIRRFNFNRNMKKPISDWSKHWY